MRIKVKMLDPKAAIPFKKHADDFCYDVVAVSCEEVAHNVYRYGTGLAFEIDRSWETLCKNPTINFPFGSSDANLSIDFRPRSSVWETGMVLSNCEGTIDEGYRGEVMATFYHVMPDMPRYQVGDRIGQIKLGATLPIEFVTVDELGKSSRGNGAYGSTGK